MRKMESEGPYTLRSNDKPDGEWLVFGPSLNPSGSFEFCGEDLASALNSAYAEGRKSMEKEFKELLDLANGMFDRIIEGRSCAKAVKDFDAWKKARGIE